MPRKDDRDERACLWDMLRYAHTSARLVRGRTLEEFEKNEEFRLAVERAIEIIGEAARHASEDLMRDHPEIPWRLIQAQRHVLAHDYGEVIPRKIWDVATTKIPTLVHQLEAILPPEDRPPAP